MAENRNFAIQFWWKAQVLNFSKICGTVCLTHSEVHSFPYVNSDLIKISWLKIGIVKQLTLKVSHIEF
jgi:hypothetical protein